MLQELRSKAELYDQASMIPLFDASAAVIKSDTVISAELGEELKRAVLVLEQVPENDRDWHPRSDGKVLDLVHLSPWPLVYGRTRIVSDRPITLDNCMEECGIGDVVPTPTADEVQGEWLPCDIELSGTKAKIVSYINNLHPKHHRGLYDTIEKFVEKILPLWDLIYRWPKDFDRLRIPCRRVGRNCTVPEVCGKVLSYRCLKSSRPLEDGEDERPGRVENRNLENDHPLIVKDLAWLNETHPFEQPEPSGYEHGDAVTADKLRDFNFFPVAEDGLPDNLGWPADRIQIIVKLANIHLTPEKHTFDGGAWHVEVQLNEHICATALCHYDNENTTPSHLAFRTRANREDLMLQLRHDQDDHESIRGTFGIDSKGDTLQELGKMLTREGHLIAFPNLYQHWVTPFELKDKTKPGHRKILALFLVDPKVPIISTRNVPLQQAHWWPATDGESDGEWDMMDALPEGMNWPISLEEAKQTRLELMEERTSTSKGVDTALKINGWNFCEH